MAKGFGGFQGGGNMNNLMKQAQKMQKQMEQTQEDLKEKILEVSSGGGAVKIKITGGKEVKEIIIDEDATDDVEMLQDLMITAVNEAIRQADELYNSEMGKITSGMSMPGLF